MLRLKVTISLISLLAFAKDLVVQQALDTSEDTPGHVKREAATKALAVKLDQAFVWSGPLGAVAETLDGWILKAALNGFSALLVDHAYLEVRDKIKEIRAERFGAKAAAPEVSEDKPPVRKRRSKKATKASE